MQQTYPCSRHKLMQQTILIWCAVLSCSIAESVRHLHGQDEKVALACENSYIYLSCNDPQERIHIFSVNYGCLLLGVCNQEGVQSGWNLRYRSSLSLPLVQQRCDGRKNCTFLASDTLFGNSCPGTKKYITVQYYCEKVNTTEITTTAQGPSTEGFSTDVDKEITTSESTVKTETDEQWVQKYCEYTKDGNFEWKRTWAGDIATSECHKGVVKKWLCGMDGKWVGDPYLVFFDQDTKNVSYWMCEIQNMINSQSPVETAIDFLNSHLTGMTLHAEDLKMVTTTVLPGLTNLLKRQLTTEMTAEERKKKVNSINRELVKLGSQLLDDSQQDSWKTLNLEEQRRSATSLIINFEHLAQEVAATMSASEKISLREQNLVMEVSIITLNTMTSLDLKLPIMQYDNETTSSLHEIRLPLVEIGHHLLVKNELAVLYMSYNNIELLMSPGIIQAQAQDSSQSINSNVISASVFKHTTTIVNNLPNRMLLERPMNFTLSHTLNMTDEVAVCVYWHYNKSTLTGEWLTDGCRVIITNSRYTTCQCDHLTNFAVLMDVTGTKLSHIHDLSLKAITYVGCVVSIVCLCMCLLTFTLFRNLQSDRNTIHKNLVLCLMIAELLFVFGIGQTVKKVLCTVIACLLHFFFLSSFSWMCLEGAQLYFMLIEVFKAERSRVRWFYTFGYGVPAIIVAIAAAIDHKSYGTNTSCWLQTKNYFILSFVIPAAVVVLINVIMLCIAVYIMCRHAGVTTSSIQAHKKGTLDKMNTWLKGATVLVVLLGLTWIFGFAYVNQDTVAMAYIFTILNSLQGLFIFIFHCFIDRKVKQEWQRAIFNATWLPHCVMPTLVVTMVICRRPFQHHHRDHKIEREQSSTTSAAVRGDLESLLNTGSGETTKTGLIYYSNQHDKLLPSGQEVCKVTPTHHGGGTIGDLSIVDGSIVGCEKVT